MKLLRFPPRLGARPLNLGSLWRAVRDALLLVAAVVVFWLLLLLVAAGEGWSPF